jgi:hypothetical protein
MKRGLDFNLPMAIDLPAQGANLDACQSRQVELRAGDLCPKCHQDRLDYDGLLNLACLACGYAVGGSFT